MLTVFATLPRCAPAAVPDHLAVQAIIGEAENQSLEGMVAVGEVIRNRGSLKGIYGVSAPRVVKKQYSATTLAKATKAWQMSKTSNLTGGADGWGNAADIKKFKTQKWFKKCRVTKQIGDHYFWKRVDAKN
jgi:spore germination cell wall hydrolase CwlJ-like protein